MLARGTARATYPALDVRDAVGQAVDRARRASTARARRAASPAPRRARRPRASRRCAARSGASARRAASRARTRCAGTRMLLAPQAVDVGAQARRRCARARAPRTTRRRSFGWIAAAAAPGRGARARRARRSRPLGRTGRSHAGAQPRRRRAAAASGRRARRAGRARCRRSGSRSRPCARTSSIAACASGRVLADRALVVERPDADEAVRRARALRGRRLGGQDRQAARTAPSRRQRPTSPPLRSASATRGGGLAGGRGPEEGDDRAHVACSGDGGDGRRAAERHRRDRLDAHGAERAGLGAAPGRSRSCSCASCRARGPGSVRDVPSTSTSTLAADERLVAARRRAPGCARRAARGARA